MLIQALANLQNAERYMCKNRQDLSKTILNSIFFWNVSLKHWRVGKCPIIQIPEGKKLNSCNYTEKSGKYPITKDSRSAQHVLNHAHTCTGHSHNSMETEHYNDQTCAVTTTKELPNTANRSKIRQMPTAVTSPKGNEKGSPESRLRYEEMIKNIWKRSKADSIHKI